MKRIPELIALSRDHQHALVLAKKAKNANTQQESSIQVLWSDIERYFATSLESHFSIEELYIGKPLVEAGEAELAERLYQEHEAIRAFFKPGSKHTADTLKHFGDVLEKHVRFEERELFMFVQNSFSPESFKALKAACEDSI